jgi:hypothetical protein
MGILLHGQVPPVGAGGCVIRCWPGVLQGDNLTVGIPGYATGAFPDVFCTPVSLSAEAGCDGNKSAPIGSTNSIGLFLQKAYRLKP